MNEKPRTKNQELDNNETLVKVDCVSKKFCRNLKKSLWYGMQDLGGELMGRGRDRDELRAEEFWAVRDVSFELKRGECLGLIGRNGAGKSTLLKMLNGLIKPDTGRIEMRGRVGALIELGSGMNPILSGRENIYINGSVLGFSKKEMDRKLEAIVEFAELGEFIDMPVQSYSSGMKVRLGFAVAAQMEPDVLLVDEVLAVGDVGFKIKCYNEINKIMEKTAVIFVSHSMPQVGRVCTRGMLMKNGQLSLASKNISEVIGTYFSMFENENPTQYGSKKAELLGVYLSQNSTTSGYESAEIPPVNPEHTFELFPGAPLQISVSLRVDSDVEEFMVKFTISDMDQKIVAQLITAQEYFHNNGLNRVSIKVNNLILNTGTYALNMAVLSKGNADFGEVLLGYRNIAKLHTNYGSYVGSAPVLIKETVIT
jgi:lipopolysaccharide transport system ATP-binding protein